MFNISLWQILYRYKPTFTSLGPPPGCFPCAKPRGGKALPRGARRTTAARWGAAELTFFLWKKQGEFTGSLISYPWRIAVRWVVYPICRHPMWKKMKDVDFLQNYIEILLWGIVLAFLHRETQLPPQVVQGSRNSWRATILLLENRDRSTWSQLCRGGRHLVAHANEFTVKKFLGKSGGRMMPGFIQDAPHRPVNCGAVAGSPWRYGSHWRYPKIFKWLFACVFWRCT